MIEPAIALAHTSCTSFSLRCKGSHAPTEPLTLCALFTHTRLPGSQLRHLPVTVDVVALYVVRIQDPIEDRLNVS